MKIIENHEYISWSVVSCDKKLSETFKKTLSNTQAHSVNCSENSKQFSLRDLWENMGNVKHEPMDAAVIAKLIEMNAKYIDVSFD